MECEATRPIACLQYQYQSAAFICNDLYAIRKELDTTQPLLVLLDINDVQNAIHTASITGEFSQQGAR